MSLFRLLNLRRFFEHRARTALSISGIAIGSALVVAVLGLFGSLNGSIEQFTQDISGDGDIEVTAISDDGFDERLYFRVAEVPGVEAAVPMIRSVVLINQTRAVLIGIDQRAERLGTRISAEESRRVESRAGAAGIFMGEGLAAELGTKEGDDVAIFSGKDETKTRVLAVLRGEAGRLNQGKFAAAPLPLAQILAGKPGKLDSIVVIAAPATAVSDLRPRLGEAVGDRAAVTSITQRAEQARLAMRTIELGMLMGAAMALTVGAFLIFNTMNMAATERRRELATLRAIGGRRRRLLGAFVMESALLGLIGSAIGAGFGLAAARPIVEATPPFVASTIGVEVGFFMPPQAVPIALALGVAFSVIAAFLPGRRAVRVSPVEAMRPEGVLESFDAPEGIRPIETAIGVTGIAAGLALSIGGPAELGFLWVAMMIVSVIVLTLGLTSWITKATGALARRAGGSGRLAASAVERSSRRAWATAAAVVVASGLVVAQVSIFDNVNDSLLDVFGSLQKIDLYVSAAAPNVGFAEVQLPGDWGDDFMAIPGVSRIGTNTFFFITFRGRRVLLQGLGGVGGFEDLNSVMGDAAPALAKASLEDRRRVYEGSAAIVSSSFEDLYGVGVGDELELATPSGPARVEVLGTVPNFVEGGLITVGRDAIQRWFGSSGVSDYGLELAEGADPAAVRSRVEEFVEGAPLRVYVYDGDELVEGFYEASGQINALFQSMSYVVVAASVLAIFNALLISVIERRRELGIMRALGTSRRQLRRMVAIEAASIGVVGSAMGVLGGFLFHRGAVAAFSRSGGYPINYELILYPAAAAVVVGVAIALLGSILPARRAASVNIIEAIGYE